MGSAENEKDWEHPPFCLKIFDYDGAPYLYGRGSSEMKGGDAAMTIVMILLDPQRVKSAS